MADLNWQQIELIYYLFKHMACPLSISHLQSGLAELQGGST